MGTNTVQEKGRASWSLGRNAKKEEEEEEKAKGELSPSPIAGEKGNQLFRRRLERGSLLFLFEFGVSERTWYLPTAPIKSEFRRRTVFQPQRRE